MNRKQTSFIIGLCTLVLSCMTSNESFAAPKSARTIPCPRVIGDKREAVLHDTRLRTGQPFQCFRNQKDAHKAGYQTEKAASSYNYTGWYRLRIKQIKDTCSGIPVSGNLALFLQVKENANGIFANFCPSTVDLQGSRSGYGLSASGTELTTVLPVTSICPDGNVSQTRQVTLTQALSGSTGFTATYKVIQICMSPAYEGKTCSREYSGIAFHETHTIWPSVSDNVLALQSACSVATQRCVECHSNFNN